jgi:hypothetical protein
MEKINVAKSLFNDGVPLEKISGYTNLSMEFLATLFNGKK